jgi:hypothetical protein
MAQWILPLLTAFLGYLVHWAQQTLALRYEFHREDRNRISSMREKLVELREAGDREVLEASRPTVRSLISDAALLRDERLRERITRNALLISSAWVQQQRRPAWSEGYLVNVFVDDSYECLSAVLRGDSLPPEKDQVLHLVFDQERAGLEAVRAWLMIGDPEQSDTEWHRRFLEWRSEYLRRNRGGFSRVRRRRRT